MAGPLAAGRNEEGTDSFSLAADVSECLWVVPGDRINLDPNY